MSLQEKPKNYLASIIPLSENGKTVDLSMSSEHLENIDSMMSRDSSIKISKKKIKLIFKKNKESVIAESVVSDRETICRDRLNTCNQNIQTTESSQILDQESTSTEKDLKPYWNSRIKELSQRLLLPIETDSVDSPLNSLNGFFKSMEHKSWFSIKQWTPQKNQNLPAICLQSSTSLIAELMEEENTKRQKKKETKKKKKEETKPKVNQVRVIRLKNIKPEDKTTLRKWFGCYRKTYNMALSAIKDNFKNIKLNKYWLRNRFVNEINIPKELRYLLDCPKHVREGAINEVVTAYQTNFTKRSRDPSFTFDIKFKSKKQKDSTILLPCNGIREVLDGEIKMFPRFLENRLKYYVKRNPDIKIDRDCRLRLSPLGEFYLHIPMSVSAPENQRSEIIALDPGVRTFLTGYSLSGCYKFGDRDIGRIYRLCVHLDKLKSKKQEKNKDKKRARDKQRTKNRNIERAQYRLIQRIKNLVKEVHYKVIKFLTDNFKIVIIPDTNIQSMVKRGARKINKKSVRNMLTWSHYTFRQRLLKKSEVTNTRVYVGSEEYTSKTCSNCGHIDRQLGGKKSLCCKNCGIQIDRDVNGSRGIFLKNIHSVASAALPR